MKIACAHCGNKSDKPAGAVNRARASGLRLFCNQRCAGLAKKKHKTKAQRVVEKAAYDADYRAKNRRMLKAKKAEYFKRSYEPAKARIERKKRAKAHAEYCRRPEYRRWKRDYDRQLRAKEYGPLAESYLLCIDLNRVIKKRMTNYEIAQANGTFGKTQKRRRETTSAGGVEGGRYRHRTSESIDLA